MVKIPTLLNIIISITVLAFSSESGSAAYRAAHFYAKGNYDKSILHFNRAIDAAKKEANLITENKLLLNLAALYIQKLDKRAADSLLSLVRKDFLTDINDYFLLISFESALIDGSCITSPLFKKIAQLEDIDSRIVARSKLKLAQCVLTNAPTQSISKFITDAEEVLVESGQLQFILGLQDQSKNNHSKALLHFKKALSIAQKKERYYRSGIILYHMALSARKETPTQAQLFFIRSFQVFDKLKLDAWKRIISSHL
ncbi:MAG: hypothetical protein OCD01_02165 [Fibrobacterales bacterium]